MEYLIYRGKVRSFDTQTYLQVYVYVTLCHGSLQVSQIGIYVVFRCKFTTFDFTLNLEVYDLKKTRLITEGLVFRKGPDELFFDKDFKKIEIKNNTLYVLNFLPRPVFSFDLNKLRDGIYNVDYLGDVAKENKNDNDLIKRITW